MVNSRTNCWLGASVGSVTKLTVGASHIVSPSCKIGGDLRYCTHQDKLTTCLSLTESLSDSVKVQAALQLNQGGFYHDSFKVRSCVG